MLRSFGFDHNWASRVNWRSLFGDFPVFLGSGASIQQEFYQPFQNHNAAVDGAILQSAGVAAYAGSVAATFQNVMCSAS